MNVPRGCIGLQVLAYEFHIQGWNIVCQVLIQRLVNKAAVTLTNSNDDLDLASQDL